MFNYEDSIMSLLEEFIKVSEQILTELVEYKQNKIYGRWENRRKKTSPSF